MSNRSDTPTAVECIKRIREEVPRADLYELLAEEATELAQAALKMNRLSSETNPTPIEDAAAWGGVVEEYTDLLNVAERVMDIKPNWLLGDFKLKRWCTRLDDAKAEKKKKKKREAHCNGDYCEL